MNDQIAISCRNLTFGFHNETLFRDLSIDIPENSFFAIIGKSGSGKTTFLRLIAGIEQPQSGQMLVKGVPPKTAQERRMISVCPQNPALLPWLTVRANVEFAFKMWNEPVDTAAVEWALHAVDLGASQDKRPAQLSGGMKARVALARAWVTPHSSVLLMDESFSALDEILREDLASTLAKLWREERRTVVYVTHVIPEAIAWATHVWPLIPAERDGLVVPIKISEEQRVVQKERGSTVFHTVLRSVMGSDKLSKTVLGKKAVETIRNIFTQEEIPSVLSILSDHHFSSRLRLNLIQLFEPLSAYGKLTPEQTKQFRDVLRDSWDRFTPDDKSILLFRIVDVVSDEDADLYFRWIFSCDQNRLTFVSVVREYLADHSLIAQVRSRLTDQKVSRRRKLLQVSTLVAAISSEATEALQILDEVSEAQWFTENDASKWIIPKVREQLLQLNTHENETNKTCIPLNN